MKRSIPLLVLLFSLTPFVCAATGPIPDVVVSIKPIHSLVSAVMQGVAEPQLLIKGAGTPHGYVLRPSEARMLATADLIIWIGEGLEGFLKKPLATLAGSARQLELAEHLAEQMLATRTGGAWEAHDHDHDHESGDHDHDDDHHDRLGMLDHHIWTSPLLAQQIVALIAEALIEIDPSHQALYTGNAANLTRNLEQLYQQVRQQLAPVAAVPYIVFHDAYQYFERDFALNAVGSVAIDTERAPGARRIREVRNKIIELKVRAVFSEPQFESRLVATVTEGTGAKTGILDPLGADLPAGPDAYFTLIRQLSDSLLTTLQ